MTAYTALTFDIDWSPDWCVEECLDLCHNLGVPATFFLTHETPSLNGIDRGARVETGIHPNFLANSTQGHAVDEVVSYCLALAPGARAMRTHALMQSTPLLAQIVNLAPQIETDVSLYLQDHDHLKPIDIHFEEGGSLTRLPYHWEDDLQAMKPGYDWTPVIPKEGLLIYDFHPIHLCLNLREMNQYRAFIEARNGKPLAQASRDDLAPFTNTSKRGVRECMIETVAAIGRSQFRVISEITRRHRAGELG